MPHALLCASLLSVVAATFVVQPKQVTSKTNRENSLQGKKSLQGSASAVGSGTGSDSGSASAVLVL